MNTAEWSGGALKIFIFAALQWGRRVNTAECPQPISCSPGMKLLQWGRRVNTAECILRIERGKRREFSFNGAAA